MPALTAFTRAGRTRPPWAPPCSHACSSHPCSSFPGLGALPTQACWPTPRAPQWYPGQDAGAGCPQTATSAGCGREWELPPVSHCLLGSVSQEATGLWAWTLSCRTWVPRTTEVSPAPVSCPRCRWGVGCVGQHPRPTWVWDDAPVSWLVAWSDPGLFSVSAAELGEPWCLSQVPSHASSQAAVWPAQPSPQ